MGVIGGPAFPFRQSSVVNQTQLWAWVLEILVLIPGQLFTSCVGKSLHLSEPPFSFCKIRLIAVSPSSTMLFESWSLHT